MADTHAANAHPSSPPHSATRIVRMAMATYHERFRRVAGVAVFVFAPLAVIQTAFDHLADSIDERPLVVALLIFLAVLAGISGGVFGAAFYAGLLDKVVGEHHYGHEQMTVVEVLRALPYRRLLAVDILLAAAVFAGLVFFVVPGIVIFQLFCLVGPLVSIEQQSVFGAFRRSAQLIAPHFWLAFCVVTLPTGGEALIERAVHHLVLEDPEPLIVFAVNGLVGATVGAWVGLIEVVLAYELVLSDWKKAGR